MGFCESQQRARQRIPKLPEPKSRLLQSTHAELVRVITLLCAWRAGRSACRERKGGTRKARGAWFIMGRCSQTDRAALVKTEEIWCDVGSGGFGYFAVV